MRCKQTTSRFKLTIVGIQPTAARFLDEESTRKNADAPVGRRGLWLFPTMSKEGCTPENPRERTDSHDSEIIVADDGGEILTDGGFRENPACENCGSPATVIDGRALCIDCWLAVPEAQQLP